MKTFLMAMIAIASMSSFSKMNSPVSDSYNYTNEKMHFQLSIPSDLKEKFVTEETENSVVFRYVNSGSTPVFAFSINKISADTWASVKDNFSNASVLDNSNGKIIYCEKAPVNSVKGKNKNDFNSLLPRVDEIIKTYKSL